MDATAPQQQPLIPSTETPNAQKVDNGQIDRVLRQKRKQHESRSCVPCKRRKVRCDNNKPCTTCKKRGHPEICVYEASRPSRRATPVQRSVYNTEIPAHPLRLSTAPAALGAPEPHLEGTNRHSSPSEAYSIASIAQAKAQQTDGEELARDVGSVLGLQNSLASYPFMDLASSTERWCGLLQVIPHRQEILSLFPIFQMRVFPFNPLLVDMDQFELDVHAYLRAYTAGEFKSTTISKEWGNEQAIGLISLILAVLSNAAHFSDLVGPDRSRVCYDLARRSFQALRLANFLFRPTQENVQTMLVLGNMLQNTGQSDAAWASLGTTARLAQTLHFHARGNRMNIPETVKLKARTCWSNIIWQDTLLSMCHARRPLAIINAPVHVDLDCEGSELTYYGFMHALCRISIAVLNNGSPDVDGVTTMLEQLDTLHRKTKRYLEDHDQCRSSLERLQHLALKMHKCFLVTFLCRPEIRNANRSLNHPPITLSQKQLRLRERAENNLIEATKTFLEFSAVSTVPLRSWSMVHTALSSVLLLCIWEETRVKPECRYLREKVIEAFSSPESNNADDLASADGVTQWLSSRHIHALVTLKDAFTAGDSGLQVDYNALQGWNSADLGQSGFVPDLDADWDPFADYANGFDQSVPYDPGATDMGLPAMEMSPTNYLNYIMGGAI
ncbi:hypothetical protein PV08_02860 [Exophiala spinifera]|uniref:Zn(2)-C6 fungal-type domain-containing protein n=1 Tax=Exophiala spinifera TaxID=91928 RepID=A0A0D2A0T3_9EURO|nr:uncharacterized protein PV08_02860 [Exophiala spinifera]KIW18572.1 hypothetical protein PV08_02860 [Exophiala spinifera]